MCADSTLMRPHETAATLQVSIRTLEYWRAHGDGPKFVRVGRHVRYRLDDISAWLDERSSTGTGAT